MFMTTTGAPKKKSYMLEIVFLVQEVGVKKGYYWLTWQHAKCTQVAVLYGVQAYDFLQKTSK